MPLGAGPAPSLSPHSCFRPVCLLHAGRRAEWPRRLGPARGGGRRLARSRSARGSTWLSPALRRSGGDGRQRAGRVRPAPLPVSESADICLSRKPAATRHGLCAVDSELPPRTAGPAARGGDGPGPAAPRCRRPLCQRLARQGVKVRAAPSPHLHGLLGFSSDGPVNRGFKAESPAPGEVPQPQAEHPGR